MCVATACAQFMVRCGTSEWFARSHAGFLTAYCYRYDEGTAFLPVVSKKHQVPVLETHKFMALDEDGYDLPPDW